MHVLPLRLVTYISDTLSLKLYNGNKKIRRDGRETERERSGDRIRILLSKVFSKFIFLVFGNFVFGFCYFIIAYTWEAKFCQELACIHLPFLIK